MSAVKVRALIGMEQGPVTWKVDVWEDPREAETFEPSDTQGFISSEEAVSSPSAPARKIFPFSPLTKELILHSSLNQQQLSLKKMPGKTTLLSLMAHQSYLLALRYRLSRLLEGGGS